ncbi:TPA: site-specific integrase [Streptococcus suis]
MNLSKEKQLFHHYYANWLRIYKEGAIREVTLKKYRMTLQWLIRLAPNLLLEDLNRIRYQELINSYAKTHERQTTMDFHHQLKGAILDAVDEGIIERDPTRKVIIKGRLPRKKKPKYLNQFELHQLIQELRLGEELNWDWLILLIAKTGIRFSEALALTTQDFDFHRQLLTIDKTWNYKGDGGFLPTKNKSSIRKIQLDWQTSTQFANLLQHTQPDDLLFVKKERIYNSTINAILEKRCLSANLPVITIHALRHTHASILLFAGVSIASVARRLGHASITTTQKTYLHIIRELENQDVDLIMRSLSGLC